VRLIREGKTDEEIDADDRRDVSRVALRVLAHGRYQQVPVNSSPSAANVSVDCGNGTQAAGQTPVTVNLKRNAEPCTLSVSKDGYEDAKVAFAKSISGWTWGNLAIGGIIGWIVDGADGAIYNRVPDTVSVNLTKK
jgi:hypothetical protein